MIWRLFATVLAVSNTGSIARKPWRSNSTIAELFGVGHAWLEAVAGCGDIV